MCKTKAELDVKVAQLRKVKALQKKLDARESDLKDDIIEYVLKHGITDDSKQSKPMIVIGDGYVLSYGDRSKTAPDVDKLKEFLGANYNQFIKVTLYKTLNVS